MAEPGEVSGKDIPDLGVVPLALELEDVLDKVVAEWALDEDVGIVDDLVCEGHLLRDEALLKAALHDAASMLVSADQDSLGHASIVDELSVLDTSLSAWSV